MKKVKHIKAGSFLVAMLLLGSMAAFSQSAEEIKRQYNIKLPEAHIGSLEIDTMLLNSYGLSSPQKAHFYVQSRTILQGDANSNLANSDLLTAAEKAHFLLMGNPMLGILSDKSVTIWLRPTSASDILVKVKSSNSNNYQEYRLNNPEAGKSARILLDGLMANSHYQYTVYIENREVASGYFKTAPSVSEKSEVRIAFGSCFHKIGLHNPNLVNQILARKPHAMMLLGDIAVDDREDNINMHYVDYLLRDLSAPWQNLSGKVPIYATWDDHDYLNNDLSGVPDRFTGDDVEALRAVWEENWINPQNSNPGIYFNTRIGPVELIMLDTRSCRAVKRRGELDSYLGKEQRLWLENVLKMSSAPFKIISSGTMWSDYVTNGKDSWGTWDVQAREQIFSFIEENRIKGVLLISGDRHGARGFTIPRENGFKFYEFEAASLGGVKGPPAMAEDTSNQLFGYIGPDIRGFGEFTFNTLGKKPVVSFRLINDKGEILEDYQLMYEELVP